ncbi:MAG: hypothetical protein [Caudoviricetes sp.]|nr:MAG: hypothetical protein [Caudoviricetes sp.]
MEKFKPTVISKEFISSVTDSVQNQNAISFAESVASSASLSDDQAMNNNYQKSQSYSRDVTGIVTGYKNADTNTIVANVKISNQSLSADVKISTIMIFANYSGNKILVATSRLNEPELLPAFDADKGTPVTIEVAVYIQVSNVVDAKVQFNDAGLATNSDLQHVDSTSVHNVGNETIDGVKTFTQPIKGFADINVRQLWDGYDLDTLKSSGMYSANNVKVLQSLSKENFSLIVEVSGQSAKQTKTLFNQDGTSRTYVRYYNKKWSDFKLISTDDSLLTHQDGDETISGNKKFLNKIDGSITGEAGTANYKNNLLKDGSDISSIETSGYYYARNASGITGVPRDFNSKYFDLTTWVNGSNGFMFIVDDANNLYYRKRQNGDWQDYTPMPLDANKFTRNDRRETIHEEWTFEKQLHATVDYAYRNILIKVNENYSADNLTEPGTYCAENGHFAGLPAYPIWGTLEVMKNIEGDVIQRFNVTNGMDAYVIQRVKNNNGWQPWRTIA